MTNGKRLRNGSAGIYALSSHRIKASFIEGYEFRGPFPRGQVVQFNQCTDPLLEDFSCENSGHVAWTEDNVNCYGCVNPIVRRGFIRGNNSPSGQGVMIENTVGGSGGAVPFPADPLVVDDGFATITLDFSQLGEPQTVAVAVHDLAATRANGKGFGDAAIILPCAAPGGVEDGCLILNATYQPAATVDVELTLPAGNYVVIVRSNVVAGTEYGYVEQSFHVRIEE